MGSILAFMLVMVFLGFLIFGCLVFPILCLIELYRPENTHSKLWWTIAIILLWPLGSYVYAVMFSEKPLYRTWGLVFIGLGVLAFVTNSWITTSEIERTRADVRASISGFKNFDTSQLTPEEQTEALNDLFTLQQEVTKGAGRSQKMIAVDLIDLFTAIRKDSTITHQEYLDWSGRFNSRAMLNERELRRFVREYKD